MLFLLSVSITCNLYCRHLHFTQKRLLLGSHFVSLYSYLYLTSVGSAIGCLNPPNQPTIQLNAETFSKKS